MSEEEQMVEKISLEQFLSTGLLVQVNSFLHIFGLALGYDVDENKKPVGGLYPMRCKFRGFSEKSLIRSYSKLAKYLKDNSDEISKDILKYL